MLKFVFWALLGVNALLFAYGQGYLGNFKGGEREPARIKNQLNTDKLTLVSAARVSAPAAPAGGATPVPASAAPVLACFEIGNFAPGEARRFESRLAALELGQRQSRVDVNEQSITSHMVFIPSPGNREGAERKVAELRELGVTNLYIIPDAQPMRGAISLGVFKSDAAAETQLAALVKQGVRGARIAGRGPQVVKAAYQFRGGDAALRGRITEVAARFPAQQERRCR